MIFLSCIAHSVFKVARAEGARAKQFNSCSKSHKKCILCLEILLRALLLWLKEWDSAPQRQRGVFLYNGEKCFFSP